MIQSKKMELKDQANDYLVNMILDGTLKPGDKISETRIAQEFNTSRTPVREAMQELTNSGILNSSPNKAPTVAQWSDDDILQLEVLRTDLENLAAKLAIIYGSNDDFMTMHTYSKSCYEYGIARDICDLLRADAAFHMQIAKIARNRQLYHFLDDVHKQVMFLLCWRKDFLISTEKQYKQHEEIISAFLERDEAKVLQLLTHHNRHAFNVDDSNHFTADFFKRG